jgi:hypothetical protein
MCHQEIDDEDMPAEIDFSQGIRGLHYRGPNAVFHFPSDSRILLDEEVLSFLTEEAAKKGVAVDQLVNDMLKQDIQNLRDR